MMYAPLIVLRVLQGYRWFQCRKCRGIFILGHKQFVTVMTEAKAATKHETGCRVWVNQP